MKRRHFIQMAGVAAAGPLIEVNRLAFAASLLAPTFTFVRARHDSGNWETDPKMPKNLCAALEQHTGFRVDRSERIVGLDSSEVLSAPFLYLAGNEAVRFTGRERDRLAQYVHSGGFVFVDDCNHDVNAAFALTFEAAMAQTFHGHNALRKIDDSHPIYRSFFRFEGGPPPTSQELNGWGDDVVHNYLRGVEINGRLGVLYSNKDYGCEWDFEPGRGNDVPESIKFGINIVAYALNASTTNAVLSRPNNQSS